MTLLAPLGLLAGLLALPILAAHVLRPQREPHVVSSTYLWRAADEPVAPSRPWQRLRWSLPLILQLLVVALLALALAEPVRTSTTDLADHTVFVVDASASMLATDGDPDRLGAAKDRVEELLDDLPDGGSASLVVASAEPELVVVDSTDRATVERALGAIRPTSGLADFDGAFTLAESATAAPGSTGWVLVSDGGVPPDDQRLAPAGTRYEPVGRRDVNRAITALAVTVEEGELRALVTIVNTGGPAATQELRVDVDGATVARESVEIPAGSVVEATVPIPPGSRVEAFLDGDDLLLNDNRRAALVPLAGDLQVVVLSAEPDGSFFVDEVLTAMGARIVDSTEDADLVVYDGVDVPPDPTVPFLSIASPSPPRGIRVVGEVERPIPTFVADDVVLRDVDVTSTAIATAQDLVVDAGTVLIGSAEGEPLLVEGRTGDVGWFHVAFDLEASNLPVEVAYPILFSRMVSDLTITDDVPASAQVGTRLPSVPFDAVVTSPRGVATAVRAGAAMPVLDRSGFWTVEDGDGGIRPVAVVFPSGESLLTVPGRLDALTAAPDGAAVRSSRTTTTSPVPPLIALALVVLAIELLIGLRRVGVPRVQWYAGVATRAVIVACLVGALIGVQWTRSDGSVRAVLVVDVSDSLGDEGRATVEAFVRALAESGDAERVAIVEVGRTVRVAKPFGDGERSEVEQPAGDGTDLVRGIRLAGSLLDGSTRERVVVVSDGAHTDGDLAAEVHRLARLGIRLDAHRVDRAAAADIAVDSVSAPARVGDEEVFELTATVTAERASSATVELRRDDRLETSRIVELRPGPNEVVFEVTATEPGLDRFTVVVRDANDAVHQNDEAYTAVSVEGPPQVLILDGRDGAGESVDAALAARAVETERRSVREFPPVDDLTSFASVVLVDVDARDLSDAHLAALNVHVRDQGNGLVVVGGEGSFALGGYADTALEALLPVESRAEDPTRKATVAEVLLIDTSESMGACHCAPVEDASDDPFIGGAIEGGINKTDISRTAAGRAIAALSADDEVGVLAFSGTHEWIVPLQPVSAAGDASGELARLRPSGETRISPALAEAAAALRASSKELKHIVLFSDGFTPELFSGSTEFGFPPGMGLTTFAEMEQQAADLAADGITVSVVATGEGAAPLLESIAIAGGGRFYPGRDLEEVPEIFVEEARIASRSFINEGDFVPTVTSTAPPVRDLASAPPLAGFLAATPKDTADVMLQVGEFADPLLSSWRVGLGKVTAWTSDGGDRWAAPWAAWDGWADFWSALVRDTFPLEGASGYELQAEVRGESIFLDLVGEQPWPAGTAPVARVAGPDGAVTEIELERSTDTSFSAVLPAPAVGSYAVAVSSAGDHERVPALATAIATRSYPLEYRPPTGPAPDLTALSESTGGRGDIGPAQALDPEGLVAGSTARHLRWILVLIAALLWPLDVVLRRVRLATLAADVRASRRRPRAPSPPPRPTPTASAAGSGR